MAFEVERLQHIAYQVAAGRLLYIPFCDPCAKGILSAGQGKLPRLVGFVRLGNGLDVLGFPIVQEFFCALYSGSEASLLNVRACEDVRRDKYVLPVTLLQRGWR
jgi:hypothetical protein